MLGRGPATSRGGSVGRSGQDGLHRWLDDRRGGAIGVVRDDRRRNHGGHSSAQVDDLTLAVGMHPAGQEDHITVGLRIDPEHRAGKAGVAEGAAHLKEVAAGRRVAGTDVEAVAAAAGAAWQAALSSHLPDGHRREHPLAIQLAFAEDHPAPASGIVSGAEQPRMPGHAAQGIGPWVVHLTDHPVTLTLLGGGTSPLEPLGRAVGGVVHAQRSEDLLGRKAVQRPPVHHPDQLAEHDVAHVGVVELGARLVNQGQVPDALPGLLRAVGVVGHRVVGDQSPAVQQQLLDGHGLLAIGGEGRDVAADRIREVDLPAFDQQHNAGRTADDLAAAGHVEDRVGGHRRCRGLDRPVAVGLAVQGLVALADQQHGPGDLLVRDGLLNRLVGPLHPTRIEPRGVNGHWRERGEHRERNSSSGTACVDHDGLLVGLRSA